jgi:two-component system, OmpR family, sensor kinase
MKWLSIRARLALWYGAVMLVVLSVLAVAVSWVHQRLVLEGIDDHLQGDIVAVSSVVANELDEGLDLRASALDALNELELQGSGVAILGPDRAILATRVSGAPVLAESIIASAAEPASTTSAGAGVRIIATDRAYKEYRFRVVAWTLLAPFEAERIALQNTIRAIIPIAFLVAATGGWVLGWRALRPLSAMAAQADRIDHRRLEQRLSVPNPDDELGRLGIAFNALLDRLSSAVQAQRRFMADASHELRTPVSIARTTAQVTLRGTSRTEPEYRESLEVVATQTQRLTKMVDDMFMLALADIDARPLFLQDVYFDEVLKDCVRSARVLAGIHGITIDVDAPADIQTRGDEGLLRQLVMNLLENAVRHTPEGGRVQVTARVSGTSMELIIEDSGPGVPDADRDRIFERFVRLAPPGSEGGAGLGLPLARWIAEQHGGTLRVDPRPGTGGRFVLQLPLEGTGEIGKVEDVEKWKSGKVR